MSEAFGHWLAGFIDGEGCFTINPGKNGVDFGCRFKLKLRADDADILREIHERLGMGRISRIEQEHGGNANPSVRWVVSDKKGCAALVRLLDEHPLRAKKARDFAIWRQAVGAWCRVERANVRSPALKLAANSRLWAEMARLHQELKLVRAYHEHDDAVSDWIDSVEPPAQFDLGGMS